MSDTSRQDEGARYEVATEVLRVLQADAIQRWQRAVDEAREAVEESRQRRAEVDEYRVLRNRLSRLSAAEVEQLIAQYAPRARRLVTDG